MIRVAIAAYCLATTLLAQQRVTPEFMYSRIWAIVPMIGSGKPGDAKRPMFLPNHLAPSAAQAGQGPLVESSDPKGILGVQMWISDDGTKALIELVAGDRSAFNPIFISSVPGVEFFERGKVTQAQVEAEFKKFKKDFSFSAATSVRVQ